MTTQLRVSPTSFPLALPKSHQTDQNSKMPTEVEGTHQIGDMSLYTKTWKVRRLSFNPVILVTSCQPDGEPVAKVVFIHGFSDHCNRYYELFPSLAARGIEVHGFDQRGWGRSVHKESEKGLTGPTSLVISDIVSVIKSQIPATGNTVPLFVMGHSMGGGEALTLASDPQYADLMKDIRGWVLESPFIDFPQGHAPSSITIFLGRLVGKIAPHKQRWSGLPPADLTRDPAVVESLKADKLDHDIGTLEGLAGMLDRTSALSKGHTKLNKGVRSLWLGHGTDDKGTSYPASKAWFERQAELVDKEFKTYEGWSHMLHCDLPDNRSIFAKDVGDWILARVGPDEVKAKL
jgi:acylglycerol lipase